MTGRTGLFVARDGSNNGTTPVGARKALSAFIQHGGGAGIDIQPGVFIDAQAPVVAGTASMSYDVRAFVAALLPSSAIGPIVAANDATVNVAVDDTGASLAAPPSNSRIDVIYCRQHLVSADGGADTDVVLQIAVKKGTAAASPTVPSVPSDALALMKVTVPTGTTATNVLTFTQLHQWIRGRGLEGTAWTAPTLLNSWVNFGGSSQVAQYRKIGDRVEIRGGVKSGTTNPIFNLPVGFRPPASVAYLCPASVAGTALAYVYVTATGDVTPSGYGTGGTNGYVDLAPISFSTTA